MQFVSYMAPGYPEGLFKLVAEVIGADLTLVTTSSGPLPEHDPFAAGQFDIGWMCSISYASLAAVPNPSISLAGVAWVAQDPGGNGQPVYFGDLVVPGDSSIHTFEDLRDCRLGCNDEVSLSGLYALRFELDRQGDEAPESFADMVMTGGHQTSLDRLIAGELDAACVDSIVRIGRAQSDADVAALRIIGRLGPWPVPPLVVRSDMSETERLRIRDSIIEAAKQPEFQAELRRAGLRDLVAVDDTHYAPVLAAMERLSD